VQSFIFPFGKRFVVPQVTRLKNNSSDKSPRNNPSECGGVCTPFSYEARKTARKVPISIVFCLFTGTPVQEIERAIGNSNDCFVLGIKVCSKKKLLIAATDSETLR
jgi:hypothetical protein